MTTREKAASQLFDRFRDYFVDPWERDAEETAEDRECFIAAFTHGNEDKELFMTYAEEYLDGFFPLQGNEDGALLDMIETMKIIVQDMRTF